MKKTIIASAVAAVVAAPAYADVTISGNVFAEYVTTDGATDLMTNNDLNVTAKEDLGNGLTAQVWLNNAYDDGAQGGGDMAVKLSGDFGGVTVGRIEGLQEGVFDAFVNVDAAHDGDIEGFISEGAFGRSERIRYDSPNMNGLSFSATAQDDGDDMTGASTEIMAKYSANGLTVMAGASDIDGGNEYQTLAVSYKMGDLELRAMTRNVDRPAAAGTTTTALVVAQTAGAIDSANAGDAANGAIVTASLGQSAASNGAVSGDAYAAGDVLTQITRTGFATAADIDTTFVGAKYTMGNNTISLGLLDDDVNGQNNVLGFAHSLSKKTTIYASFVDAEDGADDNSVIGIVQKF
jgi:hypothetical protein